MGTPQGVFWYVWKNQTHSYFRQGDTVSSSSPGPDIFITPAPPQLLPGRLQSPRSTRVSSSEVRRPGCPGLLAHRPLGGGCELEGEEKDSACVPRSEVGRWGVRGLGTGEHEAGASGSLASALAGADTNKRPDRGTMTPVPAPRPEEGPAGRGSGGRGCHIWVREARVESDPWEGAGGRALTSGGEDRPQDKARRGTLRGQPPPGPGGQQKAATKARPPRPEGKGWEKKGRRGAQLSSPAHRALFRTADRTHPMPAGGT